ncbi:unnamed protein product [Caenorhabditis nigoni]
MLSGPIDYRYNEQMMELVKNKFLDPENLKNQKFDHEQHLFIKHLEIDGEFKGWYPMEDCESPHMRGLIADHGLYFIFGIKHKQGPNHFERMYYEPYGINEHIVWN